jgi:hypothetical protein
VWIQWTQPAPNDASIIERFDADFDIRHRFVFSANYEMPFGQSFTGAARQLLAGRQVHGVSLAATTKLQLRLECYNVTNTPSFANPNAALGAPGFGSITSIGNSIPRQMQFAVKLLF